jgi:hypothetical protein
MINPCDDTDDRSTRSADVQYKETPSNNMYDQLNKPIAGSGSEINENKESYTKLQITGNQKSNMASVSE